MENELEKERLDAEKWQQQAHSLRLQLELAERTRLEAAELAEVLQQDLDELKKTNELKEYKLKSDIQILQIQIESLEAERSKEKANLEVEIASLKQELLEEKRNVLHENTNCAPFIPEEYEILKAEHIKLQEEFRDICQQLQKSNSKYTQEISELKSQIEEMKEVNKAKEEKLSNTLNALKELQEEYAVLKESNEALQAGDVRKKGNSLFAEVEDNRQYIKQQIEIMKKKYNTLKLKYASSQSQVSKLQAEKRGIFHQLGQFQEASSDNDSRLNCIYQVRITDLEQLVQSLKQELNQKVSVENLGYTGLEELFEERRKEVRELQEKIQEYSVCHLNQASEIRKLQQDLSLNRIHITKLNAEIDFLKDQLSKEPSLDENDTKPVAHRELNRKESKTVKFSSDTIEPSNEKPLRKHQPYFCIKVEKP